MTNRQDSHAYQASTPRIPIRRLILIIWLCWSTFLLFSLFWNIKNENQAVLRQATSEAAAHFNKDVVYRRWATLHGGVYVPATERTPPSPYLAHVPERDILTPLGRHLTLMNPAYMTRQAHEIAEQQYGVRGHITSLKSIRGENVPDAWEKQVLLSFQEGVQEASIQQQIDGADYLRFMRPFITESGCLRCHAFQGYKTGDIRGGISVSVPLKNYFALRQANVAVLSSWHLLIWLFGSAIIALGARALNRRVRENEITSEVVRLDRERFSSLLTLSQMKQKSEKELVEFALDEAINLSGSKIGYVHYYDEENQLLNLFHWDQLTLKDCKIPDLSEEYPLEKSGVWTDCIRQGKPVIHNDYVNMPDKKGLPEGHFPILRHMSIPIIDNEQIVGLIGVGNKAQPYLESDVTQVSLYANSVMAIIKSKRAEEDLREREHQLRRFRIQVDHSNDAIYIVSTDDGCFLDVNSHACETLGYSRTELLNLGVLDIDKNQSPDFDWQAHVQELQRSAGTLFISRHQRKDGSSFPVEINVQPIHLDEDKYLIATARDISERVQTEAELEKHRQHLEALVEKRTLVLEEKSQKLEESQTELQHLLEQVTQNSQQLQEKNTELERLNKLFVDREFRINELREKLAKKGQGEST